MGDLSPHFSWSEFADHRTGALGPKPSPAFLQKLEALRHRIGRPLRVVSGYRSDATNRAVGGARQSWHLSGRAVDLEVGYATVGQAIAAGFTGIGRHGGWAVHVDDRPAHQPVIFEDQPH